jgi:hypothetical protein
LPVPVCPKVTVSQLVLLVAERGQSERVAVIAKLPVLVPDGASAEVGLRRKLHWARAVTASTIWEKTIREKRNMLRITPENL